MLWIRLRYLAVVTLAVGIASGGASVYVRGFQEPAEDGQPVSKRPTTTTEQTPQPEISKKATGQPATAEPRARLRAQQLATRKAKANYEIAKLNRELAEIAVEEYEEGNYPRDLATIEGEIKLAESDLARSRGSPRVGQADVRRRATSAEPRRSPRSSISGRPKFTLEQAQSKRDVLVKYTKGKTIKELESEVEKALSDELGKEEAWRLEKDKEIKLERQLGLGTNPGAPEPPRRTDE